MAVNRILLSYERHVVKMAGLWLHRWRAEDLHNAMLPEVREWLLEHGGSYDLEAAMIKAIVYNSTKPYDTRTTYRLQIYIDFHDPNTLMMFKLTF